MSLKIDERIRLLLGYFIFCLCITGMSMPMGRPMDELGMAGAFIIICLLWYWSYPGLAQGSQVQRLLCFLSLSVPALYTLLLLIDEVPSWKSVEGERIYLYFIGTSVALMAFSHMPFGKHKH